MTNLFILATILTTTLTSNQFVNPSPSRPIVFGIHSIDDNHFKYQNLSISHYFTTWNRERNGSNKRILDKLNNSYYNSSNARIKSGLITVEPWPEFGEGDNRVLFLENIVKGMYDGHTRTLCGMIQRSSVATVGLRWGHEVDLYESSRYPWAVNKPELYIKAYRRFVDVCKRSTFKATYIWSPNAELDNQRFYPGNNYVDMVGMSWYSYPAFEKYSGGPIQSFNQIMDFKYNNLRGYQKPIIIAEFGVAGSAEHKAKMYQSLYDPQKLKTKYPYLHSIVLFSDRTPSWVPNVVEAPDWTVNQDILKSIHTAPLASDT
jgi:endoglucanase